MSAEAPHSSDSESPLITASSPEPEPTLLPQLDAGLSKRDLRKIMRQIRRDTGPLVDGSAHAAEVWALFGAVSRDATVPSAHDNSCNPSASALTQDPHRVEADAPRVDLSVGVSDLPGEDSPTPSEIEKTPALIAYESLPGELSLRDFLADVDARVWLPVISAANGQPLVELPVGFVAEGEEALAVDAAVVFAPALAVDEVGVRLGQGGGWYDRALEAVRQRSPQVQIFACVPSNAYVRAGLLPEEDHDIRVDGVITEKGWKLFAGARG